MREPDAVPFTIQKEPVQVRQLLGADSPAHNQRCRFCVDQARDFEHRARWRKVQYGPGGFA